MDNRQKNHLEKSIMDFNQSIQFLSTSTPPLEMYDFMPMQIVTATSYGSRRMFVQTEEEIRNSRSINQLRQTIENFWKERLTEICEAPSDVRDQHVLPLARIKKVMKSDEEVKMVSAQTPVVFAKACEMFVMELTLRAWMHTQESNRRTLQRNDIVDAIRDDDLLNFLEDIVPSEIQQVASPSLSNHPRGYVPLQHPNIPISTIYPMNMHSINRVEATSHDSTTAVDHRSAFPVNLHYDISRTFYPTNQEIHHSSVFPPPSPPQPPSPGNGDYPYFDFK